MDAEEKDVSTTEDEEWSVPHSDEESYSYSETSGGQSAWEPSPADIIQLYQVLGSKGILDLEWQCPGRRSPSVHSNESESIDKRPMDSEDNNKNFEPNEFDFEDEGPPESSSPQITPRRRTTPANSAQKRIARLDKVMFDIRRYRKMDELEHRKIAPITKDKCAPSNVPSGDQNE